MVRIYVYLGIFVFSFSNFMLSKSRDAFYTSFGIIILIYYLVSLIFFIYNLIIFKKGCKSLIPLLYLISPTVVILLFYVKIESSLEQFRIILLFFLLPISFLDSIKFNNTKDKLITDLGLIFSFVIFFSSLIFQKNIESSDAIKYLFFETAILVTTITKFSFFIQLHQNVAESVFLPPSSLGRK